MVWRGASRLTSSCSGPWNGIAGAPQARHFIMRLRRAATDSARPLNCGVSRQVRRCTPNSKSAAFLRSQGRSRVVRQVSSGCGPRCHCAHSPKIMCSVTSLALLEERSCARVSRGLRSVVCSVGVSPSCQSNAASLSIMVPMSISCLEERSYRVLCQPANKQLQRTVQTVSRRGARASYSLCACAALHTAARRR